MNDFCELARNCDIRRAIYAMNGLSFIGKLLLALPMAFFGVAHLSNPNSLSGVVPSYLPMPVIWVYLTGVALILAAVGIIIGKKAKLAAQLLALLLILFAVLVHLPQGLSGNDMEFANFFKNLAIAGGSLFMSSKLSN